MKQKIDCNWHRYVDLGLPSGLLWATCNIGAKEPWERGLYFSWGNIDGREKWSWYDYGPYISTPGVKLTTDIPVDAKYDAARANLGGSWRMPTAAEFEELEDNCNSEWTTQNGINGRMFISNINGNSVFFPAVGYYYVMVPYGDNTKGTYWSSSSFSQTDACFLHFDSGYIYPQVYTYRFYGFPVRPVIDHPKNSLLIKTIKR